ncbi:MAG: hypothetical protein Q8K18_10265 [Burkholderiales bacterium]|nr:hypothetical protein [Burkholderiales bacterium]
MLSRAFAICFLALVAAGARGAEEFAFDAAEFSRKPLEFGSYVELRHDQFRLNPDGAFYKLNFFSQPRSVLNRSTAILKPSGKFSAGIATFNFRAHVERQVSSTGNDQANRFEEFSLSLKPHAGFTLDAGKVAMKWGKGYAWNPVGFVERAKDPNDPELAREGFTLLSADFIRNLDGPLQTVAFTPVLVPVTSDLNNSFGAPDHVNVAAKLYLLYRDTDIDFMFLSNGSRTRRYGADFSRNLSSNLEIHGEWARIEDAQRPVTNAAGAVTTTTSTVHSYLLGLRYLSERDTTTILEYYRNGSGYTGDEMRGFYGLVNNGYAQFQNTANPSLLQRALALSQGGYGSPNSGRDYLYLRISQKEPFDMLYFTPAVTLISNLGDRSFSVTPELLYTGITNVELRLRALFLAGGANTDFGEKQNSRRLELMARIYF